MVCNSVGNTIRISFLLLVISLPLFGQDSVDNSLWINFEQKQFLKHAAFSREQQNAEQTTSDQKKTGKKSVFRALMFSLVLPGAGEAYIGERNWTKLFTSLEVLGWGLFISNRTNIAWRTRDYQNFAVDHARVNRGGKDSDYWLNIGKYDNLIEYNEQRRRDRNVDAIYEENGLNYWQWDSKTNRLVYDWKRIQVRQLENRETYFVGGIVLNHIISAINALRLARAYNRGIDELSWRLDMDMDYARGDWKVGISTSF